MKQLLETMLKLEEKEFEDIFQPFTDEEVKAKGLEFEKKMSLFKQRMKRRNPTNVWVMYVSPTKGYYVAWPQSDRSNCLYFDFAIDIAREVGLKDVTIMKNPRTKEHYLKWKDES